MRRYAMVGGLATAEISRLPPGTLPPFVLKFDASSLPVCLLTLGGEGLSETQLKDLAQNVIRNQLAGVPGASVPQPFGGRGTPDDVVRRSVQTRGAPAEPHGRGPCNRRIQRAFSPPATSSSAASTTTSTPTACSARADDINRAPLKMLRPDRPVRVSDIGGSQRLPRPCSTTSSASTASAPSTSRFSKQGGDSNTIAVVDGVREKAGKLVDRPILCAPR